MTEKKPKSSRITKAMFEYQALISHFPKPGGEGAHHALFRAGALGFKAGVHESQIVEDVAANIPSGGRKVSVEEIVQGVGRGFQVAMEEKTGIRTTVKKAPAKVPEGAFAKIVASYSGVTIQDIMRKSPVKLDFPEAEASWRTLDMLYDPNDILYIGPSKANGELGDTVRPAGEWSAMFKSGFPTRPIIITNPLTGLQAMTKDGSKETYIGDGNVAKFKHAVVEMDKASLEDQLAFWSFAALPVRALVLSGGRSIHAWVDVDCKDREEWEREIERELYPSYLIPLGHDPSCVNESRKSRLPGHIRNDEKVQGVMQKLIWLSPEGKAVCE